MDKIRLAEKLDNLKKPKMLVIGDFAIDEMIYGKTQRISREAPVLILEHSHTNIILGTASNAANNIATLNGGNISAMGVYGKDYHGPILIKALKDAKIKTNYMFEDKTRNTTTKTRISGSCSQSVTQQMVRIDRQTTTGLIKSTEKRVLDKLEAAIKIHDGVILSDYHLGFLTEKIIKTAIQICREHKKPIIVDAQKDFKNYTNATAITPNEPDCEKFLGYFIKDDADLARAGETIMRKLGLEYTLLTRGSKGVALFEKRGNQIKKSLIPAFNKKEVFDVTGAGDTVVATFSLALCAGLTPLEAAVVGNLAASIVIRQFGCQTVKIEELKQELKCLEFNFGEIENE